MKHLYLINDNHNSFAYVYALLIKHLNHNPLQAEQCCLIAHEVGRCHIKQGEFLELHNLLEVLGSEGLNVELRDSMYA